MIKLTQKDIQELLNAIKDAGELFDYENIMNLDIEHLIEKYDLYNMYSEDGWNPHGKVVKK